MVRIKERYLLVHILYPDELGSKSTVPDVVVLNQPTTDQLSAGALVRGIKAEVSALFGDFGAGAVERRLAVKYLSHATSTFILRTSRTHYRLVWSALTCMGRLPVRGGRACAFRVSRVSGTIRKVELEAARRARLMMLAAAEAEGDVVESKGDALAAIFGKGGNVAGAGGGEGLASLDEVDDESEDEEEAADFTDDDGMDTDMDDEDERT